ncbi:MAG: hypothetical protein Tp178MES00d2C33159851_45 [Prokaryotic dsDNA virus sp.]|nr:MAG: hypothetical protein Tp178MES00d2C33159851_45 [Prokaryotic dsDNA virus sp.]
MKSYHYKSCSHVAHLIMTFLTGGLWILIWVACAVHVSRHNAWVARQRERENHEETTELLRTIAAQGATKEQLLTLQNQGGNNGSQG